MTHTILVVERDANTALLVSEQTSELVLEQAVETIELLTEESSAATVMTAIEQGMPGPPGPSGPPGPAGYAGSQFIQSAPAAVWTVNHNLGHYVNAQVYSPGGMAMWAEIVQPNTNQLLIYFDGPQTGYVIY
jgi:hypothetical protein